MKTSSWDTHGGAWKLSRIQKCCYLAPTKKMIPPTKIIKNGLVIYIYGEIDVVS